MKEYTGSAILGFIFASAPSFGVWVEAFFLGMMGAAGGITLRFLLKLGWEKYKKWTGKN